MALFSYKTEVGGRESFGGKGEALRILSQSGFTIPDFVVIPAATKLDGLSDEEEVTFLSQMQKQFGETLLAVRSSSAAEDGLEHSFAGIFESFLCTQHSDVLNKAREIYNSVNSERVKSYLATHNLDIQVPAPAVVIQKMVDAKCAGVAFSCDPVSGDKRIQIISAVHGLACGLVDGEMQGDTYYIKDGKSEVVKCASQDEYYHLGENKLVKSELDSDSQVLSEVMMQEVAKLAKACEAHFGTPQDIEWAYDDEKLYLLQSRPITTLPKTVSGEERLWDNSNIIESYPGVTTPLTYSFARYVYENVYFEFCKLLGVPQKRVEENTSAFKTMLGLINGRIYYNLMSWYRLLALLPGFRFNREAMESMMGVKEGLPDHLVKELDGGSRWAKLGDGFGLAKTLFGLIKEQFKINKTTANFYTRLEGALIPNSELKGKNIDELITHYRKLEGALLKKWDAPLVNDFLAMIYFGSLGKMCEKHFDDGMKLQNDLLIGDGNIISAEPAQRITVMAGIVRMMGGDAIKKLCEADAKEITMWLKSDSRSVLKKDIDAYLEKFSNRTLEELKLESFTLEDDITPLYRAVGFMAKREQQPEKKSNQRALAEQLVEHKLSGIKLIMMKWVIKHARARVTSRENLRFERTKLFGHVRRIFLEIASQYEAAGVIENKRDIFFLEVEEIFAFAQGTSTCTDLKALIALRKKEFLAYEGLSADPRFISYGPTHIGNAFRGSVIPKPTSEAGLSGIGCCPGIVRAKVRVIVNPKEARLESGEILVANQTDPGWIMLFPICSAILVERGSLLSHSAIVAREMGIPAIVAIDNLLDSLKTGDYIEIDGSSGKITMITASEV
jgi:rifampicin phosphotransferase